MSPPAQIGRYQVIRPLGVGGMGAVYLAHDPELERQVAIKVLREGLENAELRERFAREARVVARLQHPNIVTIFDVGESDGALYIVMEYLAGRSLAEIIRERPTLPLRKKLHIMIDVCSGLAYAHQAGLVHRDVKPGNVIVLDDGAVKILDFGVARFTTQSPDTDLTRAGMVIGSPAYLSPEAVEGRQVGYLTDVFSAGAVFYELLTLQKAFGGSSLVESLTKVLTHTPPPPSATVPGLPASLDAIVARCLVKDPAGRYQDLTEMALDIRRALAGLLDSALSGGPEGVAPHPAATAESAADLDAATVIRFADPDDAAGPGPPPDAGDGTVVLFAPPGDQAQESTDRPDGRLMVGRSPDPHQAGRTIPIPSSGVTLGRNKDNGVPINDFKLSRSHARIECGEAGFVIRDLGSANGTYVNGRRIRGDGPEPLFFGSTITIGDTVLTFTYGRDTTLPDLTGALVAGRYRLDRLIRESAKAAVYAARDRNVPRDVAVKLLSPELARYSGYREQFEREAHTAARLQHPHVCQVLDSGLARIEAPGQRAQETHYLCFELMAGGSLAKRLSGNDPITLAEVSRWVEMLGSALQYVHDQGLVHGDLKPTAIVFDGGGHLYLTDFSIAQRAVAEHAEHTLGSPAFMAPEQWEGGVAGPAADQFAFATLAYLMISGSRPFDGQDNPEIRQKNFRRGPMPAHTEAAQNGRPGVPRAVSDVLGRALSVAIEARYASVDHFTRALLKALGAGRVAGADPLVFVSYDRELSGGWARFFADRLSSRHEIRVFMDTSNLDRAGRFPPRLKEAIEDCDVFICFLAGATLQSKWVNEEIRLAHESGKMMIPIFQESYVEPELPDDEGSPIRALISHQGVKLFDISGHFVDHAVIDLARLVKDASGDQPR